MKKNYTFTTLILMVMFIGSVLMISACNIGEKTDTNNTTGTGTGTGGDNKNGFANSSFMYFYYPKNKRIYYNNGKNIQAMDMDGKNSGSLKQDAHATSVSKKYIYVANDIVYYNNDKDKKIYNMKLDGTDGKTIVDNGFGKMHIYGSNLYFFTDITGDTFYNSLTSSSINGGTATPTGVKISRINLSSFSLLVKDSNMYYGNSNKLIQRPLSGGNEVELSSGQNDTYVFTPNAIYFRDHSQNEKSTYGVSKAEGYGKLDDTKDAIIVKETAKQIKEGLLNVSSFVVAYANRSFDAAITIDIFVFDFKNKTEKKVASNVGNSDSSSYPQVKDIKIIEDWVYYLQETAQDTYTLFRVKQDGSTTTPEAIKTGLT